MPDSFVREAQGQAAEVPMKKVFCMYAGGEVPQSMQCCRAGGSPLGSLKGFRVSRQRQETAGHFLPPTDAAVQVFPDQKGPAFRQRQKKILCPVRHDQTPAPLLRARATPAPATRR